MLDLVQRVLASEILQDNESLPKILIFVLQLEYFCILIVNKLWLLLDGLSQAQIALEHFFHHVDCVNNPTRDCIFRLISRVVITSTLRHNSTCCAHPIRIYTINFFPIWCALINCSILIVYLLLVGFLCHGWVLSLERLLFASRTDMVATAWVHVTSVACSMVTPIIANAMGWGATSRSTTDVPS